MGAWKKIIHSGSEAHLSSLEVQLDSDLNTLEAETVHILGTPQIQGVTATLPDGAPNVIYDVDFDTSAGLINEALIKDGNNNTTGYLFTTSPSVDLTLTFPDPRILGALEFKYYSISTYYQTIEVYAHTTSNFSDSGTLLGTLSMGNTTLQTLFLSDNITSTNWYRLAFSDRIGTSYHTYIATINFYENTLTSGVLVENVEPTPLRVTGSISATGNISASGNMQGITGSFEYLSLPDFSSVSSSLASLEAGTVGDNLGNHTASLDLDMAGNIIHNTTHITSSGDILVSSDIIIGHGTGSNVPNNLVIGKGALIANSTGYVNTAIGTNTLPKNTTGHSNTAIGYGSLYDNVTGIRNTAVGNQSLYNNLASYNTAVGYQSLYNNTTGTRNIALGPYRSLYSNTEGNDNVAIGYSSLYNNSNGIRNIAIGYQSSYNNTTGGQNIALNYRALYTNTIGERNIALGDQSLFSSTEGDNNIAIGSEALYHNTIGDNNIAIGEEAGKFLLNGTSGNSSHSNIFIGNSTKNTEEYITQGGETSLFPTNNTIVIGHEAKSVGSNSVVLGGDSITTTVLKGNVGLGNMDYITELPSSLLHISGTLSSTPVHIEYPHASVKFSSDSTSGYHTLIHMDNTGLDIGHNSNVRSLNLKTNNLDRLTIDGAGEVGIGTTSPNAMLDIYKDYGGGTSKSLLNILAAGSSTTGTPTVKIAQSEASLDNGDVILDLDFDDDTSITSANYYIQFQDQNGVVGSVNSEVAYSTFTGAHVSQRPSGSSFTNWKPGMIVKSTGDIINRGDHTIGSLSMAWPIVDITSTQKDKAVMGVYESLSSAPIDHELYTTSSKTVGRVSGLNDNAPSINYNALGEGRILVTDTNGDIEVGDYICSSTRLGHGEKQDDDLLHNYTVAKATQPYTFASASIDSDLGYKSIMIACTYHCG